MFTKRWRRSTSIEVLLVLLIPVVGAVALMYVTFVRKPANNPKSF